MAQEESNKKQKQKVMLKTEKENRLINKNSASLKKTTKLGKSQT